MSNACRLCLNSELLFDIFDIDGDTSIPMKISACVNIEIYRNDDLPCTICNSCKVNVNKFYDFKQECLKVDLKLRKRFDCYDSCVIQTGESDCSNILNQINEDVLPNIFPLQELRLIEDDACKSKSQYGYKRQNKEVCIDKYQCEICGRVFKIKKGLDNHLITHSGIKQYICNLCPKRYCRAENLAVHSLTHSGIKPFICEVCGKPSSRIQDLTRHMKIHNDNRDHACPKCNRHFKRSSDISSHMRTHTGVRPYDCKNCAKSYTSHNGLKKHKARCKQ